jgi:uncharacterized protein (DUF1330 family)
MFKQRDMGKKAPPSGPDSSEIHEDGFRMVAESTSSEPVVMLNLLAFNDEAGYPRYVEYMRAVAPLLTKAGGKVLYQGRGDELLIGYAGWDMVLLVQYPSRSAFTEMVNSAEYRAIAHLREEALSRSLLQATTSLL